MSQQVNFNDIVQMVTTQPLLGKEILSIWGGRCAEEDLLAFLQGWDLSNMPYRIWEYASEIVFEKGTLPKNAVLLQRGRLFGEDGDLELRRDGAEFAWRFIGKPEIRPPAGYDFDENNFWHRHSDVTFHQYKQTALLWGESQGDGFWFDDRVAGAQLTYPAVTGKRVQLHYKVFSRAGQVQFVWYTGLSEWKEGSHG